MSNKKISEYFSTNTATTSSNSKETVIDRDINYEDEDYEQILEEETDFGLIGGREVITIGDNNNNADKADELKKRKLSHDKPLGGMSKFNAQYEKKFPDVTKSSKVLNVMKLLIYSIQM